VRRAARSPIAVDLSVRRKDVRRSREVVAGETRWLRRGARSLPSLPPLYLWVGKGWDSVLKYEIRGRGGRRSYYSTELGKGSGVPKRHTLGTKHRNHNISPGRFWREKSFVSPLSLSLLLSLLKSAPNSVIHEINIRGIWTPHVRFNEVYVLFFRYSIVVWAVCAGAPSCCSVHL